MAKGTTNLSRIFAGAVMIAALTAPAYAQKGVPGDTPKVTPVVVADAGGGTSGPRITPRTGSTPSAKSDMKKAASTAPQPFSFNVDDLPSGGTALERAEAEAARSRAALEERYRDITPQPRPTSTITGTMERGEGYTIYNLGDPSDERTGTMGLQRLIAKIRQDALEGHTPVTDGAEPIVVVNYTYETAPGTRSANSNRQAMTLEALTRDLAPTSDRPLVLVNVPAVRNGEGGLVSLYLAPLTADLANSNGLGPRGTHRDVGQNTVAPYARIMGADGATEQGFAWGLYVTRDRDPEGLTQRQIGGQLGGNFGGVITRENRELQQARGNRE